jgi:hypothetical protein
VNDAVGRLDIGRDDGRAVHVHLAIAQDDVERETVHRRRGGAVGLDDVRGHDLSAQDVIGEDGRELVLVGEQRGDRAVRQLRERRISRREDRERARARQRLDETRRLHRRDERLEAACFGGDLHDVLHWLLVRVSGVLRQGDRRRGENGCQGGNHPDAGVALHCCVLVCRVR